MRVIWQLLPSSRAHLCSAWCCTSCSCSASEGNMFNTDAFHVATTTIVRPLSSARSCSVWCCTSCSCSAQKDTASILHSTSSAKRSFLLLSRHCHTGGTGWASKISLCKTYLQSNVSVSSHPVTLMLKSFSSLLHRGRCA